MTKEEVQRLYRDQILPENKNPYHFEKKANANDVLLAYNPMCGDKYHLYITEMNDVHFDGFGCAISKASTSIMIRLLENKEDDDAIGLCEKFMAVLEGKHNSHDLPDGLQVLAELRNFDGRMDCIQLSWKVMLDHLRSRRNQTASLKKMGEFGPLKS